VSPNLPNGLALNTATGVISGKPTTVTAEASYTITGSNGSGSTTFLLPLRVDSGPTVHLTATATTSTGAALTFTWKATDGVLLNTNGAQTDWLLPPGFGLHFAYVMVADGRGGFREGRLVVNTDSFGAPPVIPVASLPPNVAASAYRPPAVAARNVAKHSVLSGADNGSVTPDVATTTLNVGGSVQLADHNLPGATDPFFGLNVAATAALTTPTCITNADCPSVESTRPFGEFAFSAADPGPVGTTVTVTAQSQNSNSASTSFTLTQADLSIGPTLPPLLIPGTAAPTISAMSATFNSVSVGTFQLVWPTPAGQPSDGYPQQNWFLSFKGDDTRLSACQYYLAVGAVSTCDSSGKFTGGINFTDWRKQVQIDSFATGGAVTTTATYVNVVDLNLTRSHHSIVYPGGQVGTYVCNSLGPVDSSGKPITVNLPASSMTAAQQTAVNAAVTNAINGKNLVACVAMDYISTPINGFAQFTRFLVFGPDGELLPSVNLDGRGEKFLPGACVACHGGDSYSGKFPENGTGAPDIGAHFLPYDTGNFAFSSQAGLTRADQEAAIYQLNQNITGTNPTPNTSNLIAGWYQAGHVLDQNYVPTEWASYPDLYQTVVARSCRTCHAALPNFDWDAIGPNGFQTTVLEVCDGGGLGAGLTGTQSMPNSKVTFDRLWDSAGTSEDQPAKLTAFYQSRGYLPSTSTCLLRKAPH
jgi:hypothetical protein